MKGAALRRRRWLLCMAIAALSLRALVPTGFMLGPVDGRFAWMPCPEAGIAVAPTADAAAAAAMPAGHHHHAGHDVGDAGHAAHVGHAASWHCPFGLAAAALPLHAAQAAVPALWLALPAATAAAPGEPADVPFRHAAARGPPMSA